MHHFATPLRPAQQTSSSLRASQYKRKRASDNADHDGDQLDDDANNLDHPTPLYDLWASEQRRVAGLASDDAFQIPAPPFPHAAPKDSRANFTAARIQQELAGLRPAIFAPEAASKSQPLAPKDHGQALKTKHLNVLSTLMHRCLLEGDYDRAARAWGMILRTKAHGKSIEPRQNGLWGLGAELLMRRKDPNDSSVIDGDVYSDQGFQLARDYYELLILQYPNRIYQPDAIDATTFYPPLFSVWIMQVLQKSRRTRLNYANSTDEENVMTSEERRALEADIQGEELHGAREIRERLNDLLQSPPYDKNAQLLRLRGHVGLWISDLLLGKLPTQEDDDDSDHDSENVEMQDDADVGEKVKQLRQSEQEVREAGEYFERAFKLSKEPSQDVTSSLDRQRRDIKNRLRELNSTNDDEE